MQPFLIHASEGVIIARKQPRIFRTQQLLHSVERVYLPFCVRAVVNSMDPDRIPLIPELYVISSQLLLSRNKTLYFSGGGGPSRRKNYWVG